MNIVLFIWGPKWNPHTHMLGEFVICKSGRVQVKSAVTVMGTKAWAGCCIRWLSLICAPAKWTCWCHSGHRTDGFHKINTGLIHCEPVQQSCSTAQLWLYVTYLLRCCQSSAGSILVFFVRPQFAFCLVELIFNEMHHLLSQSVCELHLTVWSQ